MVTKQEWIDALQSGNYPKGKSTLRADGEYCCLGVLADLDPRYEWSRNCAAIAADFRASSATYLLSGANTWRYEGEDFVLDFRSQFALATVNDENDTFNPVVEVIRSRDLNR